MPRNLVLCLDGTSNEPETGTTNVARMFQLAVKSDDQLVFYDPGVGTMGARGAVTPMGRRMTRFAGLVVGMQLLPDMRHYEVTVKFDRPVNVSKFDSMVIERQRVKATVNLDGISPAHTSDGEPHMRLRRA